MCDSLLLLYIITFLLLLKSHLCEMKEFTFCYLHDFWYFLKTKKSINFKELFTFFPHKQIFTVYSYEQQLFFSEMSIIWIGFPH